MKSVPYPASPPSAAAFLPLRLRLKPNAPQTGYVDGAWWPRSRELTEELDALIALLAVRLGPIVRVAFAPAEWNAVAATNSQQVRLAALRPQERHVVRLSGADGRQLTLLVVPPEVPERGGHNAVLLAARPGNTDRPAEILTASGLPVAAPPHSRTMRPRMRTRHW